jgi:peptide chain release factor 2
VGRKYGYKIKELNYQEGGCWYKTVTFEGDYSLGYLKGENGVRLVRISPFDSNAKRHTSFASVYVPTN